MRVFILLLFILSQATKTDLEEKNLQLQRTNKALKQALRMLNVEAEAEVAGESAVGGADGTGQWNSHRPYGGPGDIFCGREWCGKYTDCTAARTELNADKDVGDLSGCPSGFVTYKAKACEKKNFWGTSQYLRECQEEGLAEKQVAGGCYTESGSCKSGYYKLSGGIKCCPRLSETQVGATYSSHYNTLKCGDIGKLDVSGGSECASAYTAVTGQSASSTNYGGVQYISGNWAPYGCHMAYTGKSTPWLYWNSQYGDGSGYGSYQTICKTEDPDYGCGPGNPAPSGCDNKCGSTKVNDECGVCGGSGILDGKCDCSGNVVDECGVCGGEGYTNMCTWCDCQKWDEPNYSDCHQVASKADAKRYAVRCEQDGSTPMPSFWTDHDEECKKYSCNL